jgi:hypothetical protein
VALRTWLASVRFGAWPFEPEQRELADAPGFAGATLRKQLQIPHAKAHMFSVINDLRGMGASNLSMFRDAMLR